MPQTKISQSQSNKNLATLKSNAFEPIPFLEVEPTTQAVTVEDPSPTISSIWDRAVQQAIVNTAVGPTIASRAYAIVHTAIFDAWAAYDPKAIATQLGDDLQRPEAEITEANKEEAMSFAAYSVLTELFPTQVAIFDDLMVELGFDPNNVTTDTATAAGIGNVSAQALLEFRREDGSNQEGDDPNGKLNVPYSAIDSYEPVNSSSNFRDLERWTPEIVPIDAEPGEEVTTQQFLTPQWGDVTPFALESGEQFRPEAPEPFLLVDGEVDLEAKTITLDQSREVLNLSPDLIGDVINPEFIEQAAEIVEASANLTDEQKLIAEFWEDGIGTSYPPGTWMTFGEFISARDDHTLDEDAQLFFALGNAVFDAGIASWEAKTYYDYPRPVRVVRELGELGLIGEFNQDLNGYAIEAWQPNQGTQTILATDFIPYQAPSSDPSPPFAEYTSGHSAFSAAGAEILQLFTGSDEFGADVTFEPGESRFEPGVTPQETVTLGWDSFTEAVAESGTSRIYGGIHFNDGDLNGRQLGKDVGQTVWQQAQFFIQGGEPENLEATFSSTTDVNQLFTGAENNLANVGLAGNQETFSGQGDRLLSNGDDSLLNSNYLQSDGDSLFEVEHDNNVFSQSRVELSSEVGITTNFELGKDIIGINSIDPISSINDLSFNQIGEDLSLLWENTL